MIHFVTTPFTFCDETGNGFPLVSEERIGWYGQVVIVNDYGRLDGIKHIKKFSSIIAQQKRIVKCDRKTRKDMGIKPNDSGRI